MALEEKLKKLLESERLQEFINKWKNGEWKNIRESYLYIAEMAHKRLKEKIANWLKNKKRFDHKIFDEELLSPVKIQINGKKYENAWKSVWEGDISEADLKEKEEKEEKEEKSEDNITGNPAWNQTMIYFQYLVKDNETAQVDELARKVLEILVDTEKTLEQKSNEVNEAIKNYHKQMGIDKRVDGFGLSRFSAVLHIIDKDNYMHMDEYVSGALKKITNGKLNINQSIEDYQLLNEFARNQLVGTGMLENLCDVYSLFKAIYMSSNNGSEEINTLKGYFESKGFHFTDEQIFAFYNALKTKGFLILAGLSGTGKTKIAQLFADLLGKEKEDDNNKFLCFLSVRPDWRDSTSLLGFYNLITEKYQSTPLLKFILRASNDLQNPYFLILDEMNLAHVEYYFADFLSVLESGRETDGFTKEEIHLHSMEGTVKDEEGNDIPEKIKLPPNLFIIGTVNIDETTYMFSPKVLDRAFTIEFRDVDLASYIEKLTKEEETKGEEEKLNGNEGGKGEGKSLKEKILDDIRNNGKFYVFTKDDIKKAIEKLGNFKEELKELNDALLPYDLGFGYRVVDEIALFVYLAKQSQDFLPGFGEEKAKDLAILMKVLPKFHGPRAKLEKPLVEVLKWCCNNNTKEQVKNLEEAEEIIKKIFVKEKGQEERQEKKLEGAPLLRNALMEWADYAGSFKYPLTAKKVTEMLARLYEIGFTSFM